MHVHLFEEFFNIYHLYFKIVSFAELTLFNIYMYILIDGIEEICYHGNQHFVYSDQSSGAASYICS